MPNILDPVKNFAIVTVSLGYDNTATSVVLTTGHGAKLPDPATEGAYNLPWFDATTYVLPGDDPNVEIVRVTAKTGDTLTITRAQEGTSASTKNTGGKTYKMILAPTKKLRDDIETNINIHDATAKTTPADNDEFGILDSAASYVLKRLSFLNLKAAIGSYLNPVGTIREFNVSTNPGTLLGFGTWAAHGTGRVTVAIDAGQTEFDAVNETGGAKTVTLTTNEMPAHKHGIHGNSDAQGASNVGNRYAMATGEADRSSTVMDNTGGGAAHNNLQPYIVVYRWVRTA